MKNDIKVLAAILLVTILIRIPFTPHEIGYDSFRTHWMAESILKEGTAKWIVHPASLFGLYPYSYPSFVPYMLAILSVVLGISIKFTILIYSILLSVISILFMFIFARFGYKKIEIAIFSSLFFVISPIFLDFTIWSASTRNLFITLMPLLLFLLLKYEKTRKNTFLALSLLLFFIEALTHRLFIYLIGFFIIPFFITKIYVQLRDLQKINIIDRHVHIIASLIFLVLFAIQFSKISLFCHLQYNYIQGLFFTAGTYEDFLSCNLSRPVLLFNMMIDYVSRNGLPFIFAPVAAILWISKIRRRDYSFPELFFVTSLLATSSLSILGTYTTLFFLPVFSLMSAVGLDYVSHRISKKKLSTHALVAFFLLTSILFSSFMNIYWLTKVEDSTQNNKWMREGTNTVTQFLNKNPEYGMLSIDRRVGMQLRALTNYQVLPYSFFNMELFAFDHINSNNLDSELSIKPSLSTNYFWTLETEFDPETDWSTLIQSNINSEEGINLVQRYDVHYIVANELAEYLPYKPHWIFYKDVFNASNKIYDNGVEGVWVLTYSH